jgi:hypothetical protein
MATGKISVTEGSGKNIASNVIAEDAVSKELQRVVLNDSAGAEKTLFTVTGSTVIIGTVAITGSTEVLNTVTVTGSTTIIGSVTVTGSTAIIGTVTVTGSTTIIGAVSATCSTTIIGIALPGSHNRGNNGRHDYPCAKHSNKFYLYYRSCDQ